MTDDLLLYLVKAGGPLVLSLDDDNDDHVDDVDNVSRIDNCCSSTPSSHFSLRRTWIRRKYRISLKSDDLADHLQDQLSPCGRSTTAATTTTTTTKSKCVDESDEEKEDGNDATIKKKDGDAVEDQQQEEQQEQDLNGGDTDSGRKKRRRNDDGGCNDDLEHTAYKNTNSSNSNNNSSNNNNLYCNLTTFLDSMTHPPAVTICRINNISNTATETESRTTLATCTSNPSGDGKEEGLIITNKESHQKRRKEVMKELNLVLNSIVMNQKQLHQNHHHHQAEDKQDLWEIKEDPVFHDVIQIMPKQQRRQLGQHQHERQKPNVDEEMASIDNNDIYEPWFHHSDDDDNNDGNHDDRGGDDHKQQESSSSRMERKQQHASRGINNNKKIVLVDKFCGEAVLRGSDIFVKGVIASSPGLWPNDRVAVYADLPISLPTVHSNGSTSQSSPAPPPPPPRGLVLRPIKQPDQGKNSKDPLTTETPTKVGTTITTATKDAPSYKGTCVFLGVGTVKLPRKEIFSLPNGVAVTMSLDPTERAFGLVLPPLHNVLPDKMMLQNLPSVLVAHTLHPQPNDVILDMCAAPGGKTSHLASLVNNDATIIACDKSRKKILQARDTFKRFGATCIVPLALDTTKCLLADKDGRGDSDSIIFKKSVQQIIEKAPLNTADGLKEVTMFPQCSFDRILLDPPCSALGLRPKLTIQQSSVKSLKRHATYQRRFVDVAVQLLKPGGYMTYSTCTVTADENERIVSYVVERYGTMMELLPVPYQEHNIGGPGLAGCGLTEDQRHKVRRFDPSKALSSFENESPYSDTMGFFVAFFRKNGI